MSSHLLPLGLINRCRIVLLKCREFDSHSHLQTLFLAEELYAYRDYISEASDREARVNQLINTLIPRQLHDGRSVFGLFLRALRENQPIYDAVVAEIDELIESLHAHHSQPAAEGGDRGAFALRFFNREYEKGLIRQLLALGTSVQVTASGGLGKTFLLREIGQIFAGEGWQAIWVDFADTAAFGPSRADEERFLSTIAQKLPGLSGDLLAGRSLDESLLAVGRHLMGGKKTLILLDNADRGDMQLLRWLRAEFLPTLSEWHVIVILATGQRMVPEWEGHRDGRPFQNVPLSEFQDDQLISQIIDYVAERYGTPRVQERRTQEPQVWVENLRTMSADLMAIALGHPLAIERCLSYAAQAGLRNIHVFRQDRETLYRRCLRPIVRERVLLSLSRPAQEAFVTICAFRYVWSSLIRSLIGSASTLWEPFSSSGRGWEYWWMTIQDTALIEDARDDRLMHPIAPLVRRMLMMVQSTEDPELYRQRQLFAYQEFSRLLGQPAPASRRAAWLIELIFHAAQCAPMTPAETLADIQRRLSQLLEDAQQETPDEYPDLLTRLLGWLRGDAELASAVDAFGGPGSLARLEAQVSEALRHWRARHYE